MHKMDGMMEFAFSFCFVLFTSRLLMLKGDLDVVGFKAFSFQLTFDNGRSEALVW